MHFNSDREAESILGVAGRDENPNCCQSFEEKSIFHLELEPEQAGRLDNKPFHEL